MVEKLCFFYLVNVLLKNISAILGHSWVSTPSGINSPCKDGKGLKCFFVTSPPCPLFLLFILPPSRIYLLNKQLEVSPAVFIIYAINPKGKTRGSLYSLLCFCLSQWNLCTFSSNVPVHSCRFKIRFLLNQYRQWMIKTPQLKMTNPTSNLGVITRFVSGLVSTITFRWCWRNPKNPSLRMRGSRRLCFGVIPRMLLRKNPR